MHGLTKIVSLFAALLLALSLCVAAPASAVPVRDSVPSCKNVMMGKDGQVDAGGAFGINQKTWYLHSIVQYQYCVDPNGPDWVRPKLSISAYNREGTHMSCNTFTSNPARVWVTYYFWDQGGRNFRKSTFTIPCNEDTIGTRSIRYSSRTTPRLFFNSYGVPRWRANFHIDFPDNIVGKDAYHTLFGYLIRK